MSVSCKFPFTCKCLLHWCWKVHLPTCIWRSVWGASPSQSTLQGEKYFNGKVKSLWSAVHWHYYPVHSLHGSWGTLKLLLFPRSAPAWSIPPPDSNTQETHRSKHRKPSRVNRAQEGVGCPCTSRGKNLITLVSLRNKRQGAGETPLGVCLHFQREVGAQENESQCIQLGRTTLVQN